MVMETKFEKHHNCAPVAIAAWLVASEFSNCFVIIVIVIILGIVYL
jgi:hypothetical protein